MLFIVISLKSPVQPLFLQYINILNCKGKFNINIIFSLFFINIALYNLYLVLKQYNSFIAVFTACALFCTNVKIGLFIICKYILKTKKIGTSPFGPAILLIALTTSYK